MAPKPVIYQGKTYSTQDAVREIFKNLKTSVSKLKIREILGLTDQSGRDRVDKAIGGLVRSGEARRIKRGIYEYTVPPKNDPKLQQKIWRAIRMSQRFTVDEIVLLSSASVSYVSKYIRWLVDNGHLVDLSIRRNKRIYQKTPDAPRQTPIWTKMRVPLKSKQWLQFEQSLWELVRLVLKADASLKQKIKLAINKLNEAAKNL